MFALHTLGHLRLKGPAGEVLAGRHKDLALLTYIARSRHGAVSRVELATLLWGERPEAAARHSLRQALLRLKRALAGSLDVQADRAGLAAGALELDATAFEADLEAARLREAVARWEGEFLADAEDVGGESYRAWLEAERERLRQRLASACERLVAEARDAGNWPDAIRFAERWAETMPLDERACRLFVESLCLAGQLEVARAQHAGFVGRLRRELDASPSPAFLELGRELAARARPERHTGPTPGSSALFTPDLVGRSGAFNQLSVAWTAAQSGDARVVVVEGDEGIGKTRLCEEFLRAAAGSSQRGWVLRSRARNVERDVVWSTARELLGGLIHAPGLAAAPAGALIALGDLVPAIRERFPPQGDASWPRTDAIAQVLSDVAAEVPLIVFVDDVTAADPATQTLIADLASRMRQARLLILLSASTDDLESAARLAPLRNVYGAERIHLHPLRAADVETLLASMLRLLPTEQRDLARRLHAETGGNPFYLIEVVAALLDEGRITLEPGGAWRLSPALAAGALPLPSSVREAVGRRLAQLSDPARQLVEAAAVLARPAESAVLRDIGGLGAAELDPALDEVIARRLLRTTAQVPGRCEWCHELARRATYTLLPAGGRRALEQSAARVLRARGEKDITPFVDASPTAYWLRVAGMYVLAAVAGLGVAHFAVLQLGLPDWVMSGAIALAVTGFPITIGTSMIERRRGRRLMRGERPAGGLLRRALARAMGASAPESRGSRGWLTWRRATLGSVVAFAGLGLVTTVYMAMRLLGIGPVGSLVASGVLRQRERLILAVFQNRSTDSTLGPSLSEAFRIDLSQSPTVKLVDAQTVMDELQRMRRAPGTSLDLALAREVAIRLGIKAVLTGQIDPVGRGFVLSASLVSAGDGQVLTGVRETADNDGALIHAIDQLSKKLRERIGESLRTIRANPPLERVTTGSLEALRKYSEGVRAYDERHDDERAISLLEEATALDTGFGMAYGRLADALAWAGAGHAGVIAAATKAFEHRDRMPTLERYITTGDYYEDVDRDLTKQMEAGRSAFELDSDDFRAIDRLAWSLLQMQRWAEAESLYLRGARLRNAWQPVVGAIWAQVAQGHLVDAQATLDRYSQTSPRGPAVPMLRAGLASGQGDYATAEQEIGRLRREQQASPSWTNYSSAMLAALAEVRGQLARAAQHWRDYMAESEQRGLPGQYLGGSPWGGPGQFLGGVVSLAWLDLRYRNRASDGLKEVDAALKRHPLSTIAAVDRPYTALAAFFARAGRLAQAKRLLAEFETTVPEGIRRGDLPRHEAAAEVALAEGRTRDAVAAYRRWHDEIGFAWATGGLFEIASIYDRAGQADSALVTYEQVASTPGLWRFEDIYYTLAPTYKRLGELYEARGDRAKAREYYGRFVELWKDADPELQPTVASARAELNRLSVESR